MVRTNWLQEIQRVLRKLLQKLGKRVKSSRRNVVTIPTGYHTNDTKKVVTNRSRDREVVDQRSLLMTGVTRDGLWLIEDGKISKSVRNFRISESPLFALNNMDQLGVPTPVYRPFMFPETAPFFPAFALSQVIVSPLKLNDFSFTSSIDAI